MKKAVRWTRENPWILVPILLVGYYLYTQLFNALAQRHFDEHCENDAGEFIYKTVDNVEGVFQMRPRDPTKYYFDNLRHYQAGSDELIEDPFGHTDAEGQRPWILFVSDPSQKYHYFETTKEPDLTGHKFNYNHLKFAIEPTHTGEQYWRYELSDSPYNAGGWLIFTMGNKYSIVLLSFTKLFRKCR